MPVTLGAVGRSRVADGLDPPVLDAAASYPLGIDDNETFKEATMQLERGDTVLLYSDGITGIARRSG